ncbi:aromatic ring-hydroxylating dioxygenase subunit alpha [Aphanothece sacrum]|uniref:Rieske (2Fe-2S) domain protein n=1 Tax=Aphanothece sacrum FPU1 TaxID=1920663 RepID=A0A401IEY0_APHSA|nr:aromatic ring-hydroxylating dioxygenase subunit alpha [Aphanothece sacrum]GBF79825.1 Rieske (2Fe-2S) domain protein [Aphanothece sacrum FPU1]GBF84837.1 Rieske (2Fe-2S) domain protein [Aphanothece sacrum FPU3]
MDQFSHSSTVDIRTCGINLNHWYVVARNIEVTAQPLEVLLWHDPIVLYRDEIGKVHGLENRCPHRQVKLSEGKVVKNSLECAYHGWQFNEEGHCTFIPYLTEKQKIPNCQIYAYPVQELDGFIWLFPGDKNELERNKIKPMGVMEWEHLNYIATVSQIECRGHFSFLIENLMDMYHGHLHENYQAWTDAQLKKVSVNEHEIKALYEAQSYYKIDKIWSIFQLFFPSLRRLHSEPLEVIYLYPHWISSLGNDFKIYCLLCPVNETYTKAYLIHFTSLNSFWRLHKLPKWFRQFIKNSLFGTAQKMLDGLVRQDIKMIEQEQESYLGNSQRRTYEVNPTISQVQKLIKQQLSEKLDKLK